MAIAPIVGFAFGLDAIVGGWLGWQLPRQNGRILLRLDKLEKRLNELEFGGADEPEGLPIGSEAPPFDLPAVTGNRTSHAQYRGQPVLLMFFNPARGCCREMAPKLAALPSSAHPFSKGRADYAFSGSDEEARREKLP